MTGHKQNKTQTQNQAQTNAQTNNQVQTNAQQTQEPKELEIARKILSKVKQSATGDSWVSERLIEGNNVVVTASSLDGNLITLWIKPTTLKNGYPILLDETLEDRLNELEEVVQMLKRMLPVLKEFVVQRGKRTSTSVEDRIVIRRKY